MSWKRLPTYFANIPLKLMPLSEQQQKAFETNGTLKQAAFQTIPKVSKVRHYPLNAQPPVPLSQSSSVCLTQRFLQSGDQFCVSRPCRSSCESTWSVCMALVSAAYGQSTTRVQNTVASTAITASQTTRKCMSLSRSLSSLSPPPKTYE